MLVLLSPSKSLNIDAANMHGEAVSPVLLKHSCELINLLKEYSAENIKSLMKISDKLAQLNYQRFEAFSTPFTAANAKQGIYMFTGDVYDGLNITDFTDEEINVAQSHIRILSGLYGLIRPLDLIQPYRLEMGTKLANLHGKNIYEFWGDIITNELNKTAGNELIINLASNEYFKAVKPAQLKGKLITVNFKEHKDGAYKIIGLFAKRARGMMARYIVKNRVNNIESLINFDDSGYIFNPELSSEDELIFTR